jgi:hypothetical protein
LKERDNDVIPLWPFHSKGIEPVRLAALRESDESKGKLERGKAERGPAKLDIVDATEMRVVRLALRNVTNCDIGIEPGPPPPAKTDERRDQGM